MEQGVQGEGFEMLGHETSEREEAKSERPTEEQAGEAARPEAGPLPKLDVYSVLHVSIAQLVALGWQKMGLQADPFTNQIEKDLAQARLAIDAASALLEQLLPHLDKHQARDYQTALTDLRLNFVRQSATEE